MPEVDPEGAAGGGANGGESEPIWMKSETVSGRQPNVVTAPGRFWALSAQ